MMVGLREDRAQSQCTLAHRGVPSQDCILNSRNPSWLLGPQSSMAQANFSSGGSQLTSGSTLVVVLGMAGVSRTDMRSFRVTDSLGACF